MALPQAQAAVDDIRRAHRNLLHVVDSLSAADWERPVPYGEWTVRDVIAHAVGDMSPSGPGLIHAGVLTPEFIAATAAGFDVRARNDALVQQRRSLLREDLRQMLFECHHAMVASALKLDERHLPTLEYTVPMGPGYDLRVEDWLWHGYHDRQHADDIRRALETDYRPEFLEFLPEIRETFRLMFRRHEGFLRAVYTVADDAWNEPSGESSWSYKDALAHVAANDLRSQGRIRDVLGEGDESELAALNETDAWNQRRVDERRERSVRELVDELAANRYETLRLLSRLQPEHLAAIVTLGDGSAHTVVDYVAFIGEHESLHAGQFVAASRARRASSG
jgi:uncharacterized damage-inducible protein DinB